MIGWARDILLDPRSAQRGWTRRQRSGGAAAPARARIARSRQADLGARLPRTVGAPRTSTATPGRVRASARSDARAVPGDDAWRRRDAASGVDARADRARRRRRRHHRRAAVPARRASRSTDVESRDTTVIRSPYARDFVYAAEPPRLRPADDGHAAPRRGVVLPRGVAAHRGLAAGQPDIVHAHALHQAARLPTIDMPVVDQSARRAESALHRRSAAGRRAGVGRLGARANCRRCSAGRSSACRKASMRRCSRRTARASARRLASGRARRAGGRRLVPIKNVALLVDAMAVARRDASRRASGDRRRRPARRGAEATRRRTRARARRDVRRLRPAARHCRRSIAPPTCSRSRRTSTTRRTSCSKRWRAALPVVADRRRRRVASSSTAPAAASWCRRAMPDNSVAAGSNCSPIAGSPPRRRRAQPAAARRREFSWRASAQRLLDVYTDGARRARTCRLTHPHEGRDPRRRHVLLHGAGDARARLSRRLGSRARLPGDRAVRDRLRTRGHSPRALALGRSVSARDAMPRWRRLLKTARRARPRHDRAARLHAPGLSGRLRVSGRAGSRAARRGGPRATSAAPLGSRDLGVRAAAQRAVEARPGGGRRRRAEPARIVPVVPAVDAPVGLADAGATGGASARFRQRPAARKAIGSSIRTCCATPTTPSSAATAWFRARRSRSSSPAFEEARRAGGDFCLATHYWEVDATMKGVLLRFLDHAARDRDVRFVAAEALFA